MQLLRARYWILPAGILILVIVGLVLGRRTDGHKRSEKTQANVKQEPSANRPGGRTPSPLPAGAPPLTTPGPVPDMKAILRGQIEAFRKTNNDFERREILARIKALVERDPELLAELLTQLCHDPTAPGGVCLLRVSSPMLDPLPMAVVRMIGENRLLDSCLLVLARMAPLDAANLLHFFRECAEHGMPGMRLSSVTDAQTRRSLTALYAETADRYLKDSIVVFVGEDWNTPDVDAFLREVVMAGGLGADRAVSELLKSGGGSAEAFLICRLNDSNSDLEVKGDILSHLGMRSASVSASTLQSARAFALSVTAVVPAGEVDPAMRSLHVGAMSFLSFARDPGGLPIFKRYVAECGDTKLSFGALLDLCRYDNDEAAQVISAYANDPARTLKLRKLAVGMVASLSTPLARRYLETLSNEGKDAEIRELAKQKLSDMSKP